MHLIEEEKVFLGEKFPYWIIHFVLGEKGKTVIVTIHQPSSELYELFDKVMLMADGRIAFLGELDVAASFFAK